LWCVCDEGAGVLGFEHTGGYGGLENGLDGGRQCRQVAVDSGEVGGERGERGERGGLHGSEVVCCCCCLGDGFGEDEGSERGAEEEGFGEHGGYRV